MSKPRTNKDIFDALSKKVIGHDYAKKVLINIVNRSKRRYFQKYGLVDPAAFSSESELLPLSNCLLVGDSGTGKTYLVETLSKIMKFPYLKIDATELNPTGASGGIKKKDFVNKIINRATDTMEADPRTYFSLDGTIDQMIVFVDEMDKLAQKLSSDWNEHVQSNFLTLFENKDEAISGVTYVFAGAFTGMDKYNNSKNLRKPVGFSSYNEATPKTGSDLTSAIIEFGLLPEIVGRLQHIVLLDELNEKDYEHILIRTLLPQTKKDLESMGIKNFTLSAKQIAELAKSAKDSGLGVRHLKVELSRLLVDIEFEQDMKLGL